MTGAMVKDRDMGARTGELRLDLFLPYRLSVASNAVSTRISRAYRGAFDLKVTEWRLIAILAEGGAMTAQALVGATRMDKVSISRAAKALQARGLIEAEPHGEDGRSRFLSLSAAGHVLYAEIAPQALAMEAKLLADFTGEERALLETLLRRIEAAAGA